MTGPLWTPDSSDYPPPGTPFEQVREWETNRRRDGGVICPCCQRHDRTKHRPINSGEALALILLVRAYRRERRFWHTTRLFSSLGYDLREIAKLGKYWGLVEEENIVRPDGGHAGHWRPTRDGLAWADGLTRIASHVWEEGRYRPFVLDHTREVTIDEVMADSEFKFHLDDLRGDNTPRPPDDDEEDDPPQVSAGDPDPEPPVPPSGETQEERLERKLNEQLNRYNGNNQH